ncbi:hypothetical protein ACIQU4_19325 [Streptomyces sp. NPDC090741]|uniref:hypothetical protein n=1 Tax=Streptomyces sp. NPDC090741 TaxID=3365967 RepID=UPI0037F5797E
MVVSCWTAWQSWSTRWAEPRAGELRILGGTWMHAPAGFRPGSRVLTQRYAEHLFPADGRDEPAAYDPDTGEQVALLDGDRLHRWRLEAGGWTAQTPHTSDHVERAPALTGHSFP